MTSRYHLCVIAPVKLPFWMVEAASRSLRSVGCLPVPFCDHCLLKSVWVHSHHTCHSPSWNPSSLPLCVFVKPNAWTNSAHFLLSFFSGGWMLLEENSSDLKNVASRNVWCQPHLGLQVGPVMFPCAWAAFPVSPVARLVLLHAWQASPVHPFPVLICFVSFHYNKS